MFSWNDCLINGVPTLRCLNVVIANLLFLSNGFIIIVLFVMFVYGSFIYLTSFGSEERVQKAQGIFKWALIGLALYISSYLILRVIDILFLGGEGRIFQFGIP